MSFKGNTAEVFNRLSRFEPFSKGLDALRRIPKDSSKTLPHHFPKENTSTSIHQRLSSTESNFRSSLEGDLSQTYTKNTPNATKKYFEYCEKRSAYSVPCCIYFNSDSKCFYYLQWTRCCWWQPWPVKGPWSQCHKTYTHKKG